MIEGVQFLYNIYKSEESNKKQRRLILAYIFEEMQINSELVSIILKNDIKKLLKYSPSIFQQFETSSYDLIVSLNLDKTKILSSSISNISKDLNIKKLKDSQKYQYKSDLELYEFYIKKLRMIAKLSKSGALSFTKINLTKRLKNIAYAVEELSKRKKNEK